MAIPGQPPKPPGPDVNQLRQQFFKSKQDEVNRQFTGAQQEQQDALTRRFTALGQAGSGAAMGAQLKGQAQLEGQRSQALGDLGGQEAQMAMASQEAQLGRDFAGAESALGRDFQGGEAQKARDFQGGQFDREFGLKGQMFDFEKGSKLRELDMAQRQQDMDQMAQLYNQAVSTIQSPYGADRMQRDMMDLLRNLEEIKSGKMRPQAKPVPAQGPPQPGSAEYLMDPTGQRNYRF